MGDRREVCAPRWYRCYVLGMLMLIYAFSFLDRQLIGVLAPFIKRDLGISDAQIGLLFGTSFALFYGLFGIGLAKLADAWNRVNTLALGLCLWSAMTAVSGAASSFVHLGLARIGVGVGEASSSPAAVSLLSDYFRKERRSTIFALYSVGIYIGAGASLAAGGAIVGTWERWFPDAAAAPLGLHGWQAAFIAIGLPGIACALLVKLTVRDPGDHMSTSERKARATRAFSEAGLDILSMIPLLNLALLKRAGAGPADSRTNLARLGVAILAAWILTMATNAMPGDQAGKVLGKLGGVPISSNMIQWCAFSYTIYAVISWIQLLKFREPLTHAVIVGSRCFVALAIAAGFVNCAITALNSFVFVYGTRYLHMVPGDGVAIGVIGAVSGASGMAIGGVLGDWARRRHPAGRIRLIMAAFSVYGVAFAIQYNVSGIPLFLAFYGIATFAIGMWQGPIIATVQDLVLPNMRGLAFAVLTLGPNVLGLGLGPYVVGMMSDVTGDLRISILMMLGTVPPALGLFYYAAQRLPIEERALNARPEAKAV